MVKAFVFGKFLPFHKGHQAMIEFALAKCDQLTVLVCCSDKESISSQIRREWIEQTFEGVDRIQVKVFGYLESELPNTSVSSLEVSRIWSAKFKKLLPRHTLLVTSEPYGNYVADFMGIRHELFDLDRTIFPVSATSIRNYPSRFWDFIPDAVKPYFQIKVVLLGTESTGKTTLTQKLSQHFGAPMVLETAREIIKDSKEFCVDDLHKVAHAHAKSIATCPVTDSPLCFIDTDVHITQSYASFVFQKELDLPQHVYDHNKATLYLYLNIDAPFIQDGTRLDHQTRDQLDQSHRQTLEKYGIAYHEIKGNWCVRFEMAVALVNQVLSTPEQVM